MKRVLAVLAAMLGLLVSAGYAAAEPQGPAEQALGQSALSGQAGAALSGASQTQPTNANISVRILSPGNNGDVKQSNSASSSATAANANVTDQSADQKQGGGCGCPGGTQAVGQEAKNDQAAGAASVASQSGASNTNIPVRILSPGDNGSVSQSNKVDSDATAANLNGTKQDADQDQGGSGIQAIGQEAQSSQQAGAASKATQDGAANTNISVRILSPGDDGHVSQSNSVDSDAKAVNANATKQDADQDQGGHASCGCSSGGIQAIGQEAKSDQDAGALSVAKQTGASNTNIPVRVLSPGDNGSVRQSNSVDSDATAANVNLTSQDADQDGGGSGIQAVGQEAKSDQTAIALSGAFQIGASNTNTPVRVGSKGDDGHVSQSNSVDSDATAANLNGTKQDADQDQGGSGIQAIGQESKSDQTAVGLSGAIQLGASNTNTPVAVGGSKHDECGCHAAKDGKGHGGDVDQSNSVDSDATAANLNLTSQDADQDQGSRKECGCHADGIQAIGQSNKSEQDALAGSLAVQAFGHDKCGCSSGGNSNTPVNVDGKGHAGGDVDQSNSVDSDAKAVNLNATKQDADQDAGGGKECGCHGSDGIQAIGQENENEQKAVGLSAALQFGASNSNTPVSVDGKSHDGCGCDDKKADKDRKGHGGDVDQSNSVDSDAKAVNLNATKQDADQDGGSGIQAIGQENENEQKAVGLSAALQFGASNSNTPVSVDGKGHGGDVDQSNSVDSDATAANLNLTSQDADQDQGSRKECGCHADGIQAIGQSNKSEQDALAGSLAVQAFGHDKCGCSSGGNSNTPVNVDGKGHAGGDVDQSNSVDSDAKAVNLNATKQDADQDAGGGKECGCHGSDGIQAIGQENENEQKAVGLSAALQFGASNSNTPVSVGDKGHDSKGHDSKGHDRKDGHGKKDDGKKDDGKKSHGDKSQGRKGQDRGDVSQSNHVDSGATAANLNATKQDADQDGSGIQAIGQEAHNAQAGLAFSLAAQFGARNSTH